MFFVFGKGRAGCQEEAAEPSMEEEEEKAAKAGRTSRNSSNPKRSQQQQSHTIRTSRGYQSQAINKGSKADAMSSKA